MMDRQQNTLEILNALIGFPTVSRDSNLDIVSCIEDVLARHGVASRRIPDRTGRKASILATIGPKDRAGVVLSAHTDVVPVDGQNWTSPPFAATSRDGRIVGRGATDMKGFIACVLGHVPQFKTAATETPIHIAFSYDEEIGCLGAPDLVDAIAAHAGAIRALHRRRADRPSGRSRAQGQGCAPHHCHRPRRTFGVAASRCQCGDGGVTARGHDRRSRRCHGAIGSRARRRSIRLTRPSMSARCMAAPR